VDGEWGFQYYGQQAGGQPLLRGAELKPGDWLLTSKLGFPLAPRLAPGTSRVLVRETLVVPGVPFRLIALHGRSAFSSVAFGVRPFAVSGAPADILTAERIVAHEPVLSYLPMDSPEADQQILSGVYQLEAGRYRWMGARAGLLLKNPGQPSRLEVALYIPPQTPARRVSVSLDDKPVAEQTFAGPGSYTLTSSAVTVTTESPAVTITVDKTFAVAGDQRELGIILTAAGFKPIQ